MTVREISMILQAEGADRDEGVVEAGNDGRNAIDQLKAKPEIHEHAGQRIEGRQLGLVLQLFADLGADDFDAADGEAGEVGALLERGQDGGIDDAVQLVDGIDECRCAVIAIIAATASACAW